MARAKKEKKEESPKSSGKEKDELIATAIKRLKKAWDADEHNRNRAIEDLKFLNGDQWGEDEKKKRTLRKRPMLTINMLPEKVDKVIGDMRQNRARIKIRPMDAKASGEIARIREGLIAGIEYNSNASMIYDYAGGRAAECGHGAWRILTRYCEDNPFVQEIYLKLIKNSFAVFLDPDAQDPCKSDAKWGFILSSMTKDEFEEKYPGKALPSEELSLGVGLGEELWYDDEKVTVAEYFTIEEEEETMCLMSNGDVVTKKEADESISTWEKEIKGLLGMASIMPPPPPGATVPQQGSPAPTETGVAPPPSTIPTVTQGTSPLEQEGPKILKEKKVNKKVVMHRVITSVEVLDGPNKFPGRYIPIVEVLGKERNIEGKDYRRGLITDAKDPQRMLNYWNTAAAETIALAPKAPWLGTPKQFEGFEEDYAAAHEENFPYLKYNPDEKTQGTPPVRTHPGDPPVALFTQIQVAEKNLHSVVGMGPDMRDVAPDASQKAIIQRQKPAELSTFPFIDNLAGAILFSGKIINEMIPEVYDTERDIRIRNLDETETFVPINMKAKDAIKAIKSNPEKYKGMDIEKLRMAVMKNGESAKLNVIGAGRFETVVDIGPSYATQRQESADGFLLLAQTNPRLWQIAGDLIVKSLDINGAEAMADRIRKTLPPGLAEPKPGEAPPMPQPPSPQAQLAAAKTKTEEIKQQKETIATKVELVKLYKETKETETEVRKEILNILTELHAPDHPADHLVDGVKRGSAPPANALMRGTPPPIMEGIGGMMLEGRAMGGLVNAGQPYVVGEMGRPEVFVPKEDGYIIPNPQTIRENQPVDPEREYINSIFNKNASLDFVQRAMNPNVYPSLSLDDGSQATHLMSWGNTDDGRAVVFPQVVYDNNTGNLVKLSAEEAIDHAIKTGEYIEFDSPDEAEWFSSNYKRMWGE